MSRHDGRRPRRRSVAWRVFGSYLVVVLVASAGAMVAGEAFAPYLLDRHMREMAPMLHEAPMTEMAADLAAAYRSALTQSLSWAALVATVAAAAVAWTVTRRLLAPLGQLSEASHAIAAGQPGPRLDEAGPGEYGELARAFNAMASALEHGEAIRRQLLSDLSHELRTPLTNVRGYLEAIEDGVFTLDAATTAALRRQVDRMDRLVADLSLLSRLEAGQVPVTPERVDLAALVADSVAAFAARFEEQGVELAAVIAEDRLTVLADPVRTGQVLENLLANALRHTPAGGRVVVRVGAGEAGVGSDESDGGTAGVAVAAGRHARVEVRDTGPGVPEAMREAIFRRFVRGDPARGTEQGQGSGIGLTIARELVTRQGGTIGVGDAPGGGAAFVFTLPRAA